MPRDDRSSHRMNRQTVARALSILAHPALLVPATVVGLAVHQGASPVVVRTAATAAGIVAAAVLLYSVVRVRAGHWAHADASRPAERLQLNVFLAAALLAAAGWANASGAPRGVTTVLLLCASIVGAALLVRRWLTLSLHLAFATFAAVLSWPTSATLLLLLVAAGLAWSRLVLRRHTPAEVLAGASAGAAAGVVFHALS